MVNVYKVAIACLAVFVVLLVADKIAPAYWWVQWMPSQPHDIPHIPEGWDFIVYEDRYAESTYATANYGCSLGLVKQGTNSPNATTHLTMQCMEEQPVVRHMENIFEAVRSEPSDFTFTAENLDHCLMSITHDWRTGQPPSIGVHFACSYAHSES